LSIWDFFYKGNRLRWRQRLGIITSATALAWPIFYAQIIRAPPAGRVEKMVGMAPVLFS
jgi:hypothetical protein